MYCNKVIKCSIIIRAFNEEKHIGRLLTGIAQQTEQNIEVIVVDSGSKDNTVAIALANGAKVIHIAPKDFSFGRALNLGCLAASGELLLFASAHVYPVFTDWICKMTEPFANDRVALVYGRQTGNKITKFSEQQIFKKWFPEESNYHQNTPFCNNANCAIRKSLWQDHPFDEYLTGLEDLDWAQKIMSKRYCVAYEAEATIVHVHEESLQKIKNRYQREAIAFKHIFSKIHFNIRDFAWLFVSNTLSDMFHAIQQRKLLTESKGIVAFRLMQFWGTYLGHQQKGDVNAALKNRFYYSNGFRPSNQYKAEPSKRSAVDYNYT